MKPAIPFPLSLALSAFLLAACGNKADLFMPPPPEPESGEVADPWEGEDPFADDAVDGEPVADPSADDAVDGEPAADPFAEPLEELRVELLAVNGIGPETADSILLYAGSLPKFVIDAYTRRIFSRHGLCPPDIDYHAQQALFEAHLPRDLHVYGEYHGLIVFVGKDFCRRTPKCDACPLGPLLDLTWVLPRRIPGLRILPESLDTVFARAGRRPARAVPAPGRAGGRASRPR